MINILFNKEIKIKLLHSHSPKTFDTSASLSIPDLNLEGPGHLSLFNSPKFNELIPLSWHCHQKKTRRHYLLAFYTSRAAYFCGEYPFSMVPKLPLSSFDFGTTTKKKMKRLEGGKGVKATPKCAERIFSAKKIIYIFVHEGIIFRVHKT